MSEKKAGKDKKPMATEYTMLLAGVVFFFPVAIIYYFVADKEPVGVATLMLLGCMFGFAGGYLWLTSRRIDARWEDDEEAEIADGAGLVGEFTPSSWWPLVAGIATTIVVLGPAVSWWITVVGVLVGVVAIGGWVFDGSRGIHKH